MVPYEEISSGKNFQNREDDFLRETEFKIEGDDFWNKTETAQIFPGEINLMIPTGILWLLVPATSKIPWMNHLVELISEVAVDLGTAKFRR